MLTKSELATLDRAEGVLIRRCMLNDKQQGHRGCATEAGRELYADLPAWLRASQIAESLPQWSESLTKRDWRYKAALKDWSACIRYADPEGPAAATCDRNSSWSRTARTLNVYYSDLLHRRYRKEIETRHRLRLEALPRARAIVDQKENRRAR